MEVKVKETEGLAVITKYIYPNVILNTVFTPLTVIVRKPIFL